MRFLDMERSYNPQSTGVRINEFNESKHDLAPALEAALAQIGVPSREAYAEDGM